MTFTPKKGLRTIAFFVTHEGGERKVNWRDAQKAYAPHVARTRDRSLRGKARRKARKAANKEVVQ